MCVVLEVRERLYPRHSILTTGTRMTTRMRANFQFEEGTPASNRIWTFSTMPKGRTELIVAGIAGKVPNK